MPVDYGAAYDWFVEVFRRNGGAVNNIGVMIRDGLAVPKDRSVAFALFLTVHMTGMGGQGAVARAYGNLRRDLAELPEVTRQRALCFTLEYVMAYAESKGTLVGIPENLRPSPTRKRIRDLPWWQPGELPAFICPEN